MSLLKQLLISVTVAILCILVGTLVLSIDGARTYLNNQLQAQSENAASSLALSLSQPANQDEVLRELLMSALFDSGQFRQVRFSGVDGQVVFDRSMPASVSGTVPEWFSQALPLTQPSAMRYISDGWKQVGELTVTADDLFARETLWKTSARVLLLVVGAGLLWALFVVLLMRWLKRVLNDEITEQVRAIAEGGTPAQSNRRRVAELSQATQAIKEVRQRVRATAQEQVARIESLQLELNSDPVTGLANRKFFVNELRRVLQAGDAASEGHVLIFRQRDLAGVNAQMARAEADSWLRSVGETVLRILHDSVEGQEVGEKPLLARLNGSDFVLLLPVFNGLRATRLVEKVRQALSISRVRVAGGGLCRWSLALTDYSADCLVSDVLARLDHGLMSAESAGKDNIEVVARADGHPGLASVAAGEKAWRSLIDDALLYGRLELSVQPLVYENDTVTDRHEATLALRDEANGGSLLSGHLFMPAAVRLGLSAACDLRAIDLGLTWLSQHPGKLVVRVSLPSLLQPHYLPEMKRRLQGLKAQPETVNRLILEIDAHGLVAYADEVEAFCREVVSAGAGVGLRRLAEQPAALLYLHRAPLHYIKLGGDIIGGLMSSPGAMQLMVAISETAIGMGIKVYADEVGDAGTAAVLREYGVQLAEGAVPAQEEREGGFEE